MVTNVRIGQCKLHGRTLEHTGLKATRASALRSQGKEIWLGHPDRLLVMEDFINNPKTYRSLVKAMRSLSVQQTGNRAEVAKLITEIVYRCKTEKQGAPVDKFTRPGIVGEYDYGGFDDKSALQDP